MTSNISEFKMFSFSIRKRNESRDLPDEAFRKIPRFRCFGSNLREATTDYEACVLVGRPLSFLLKNGIQEGHRFRNKGLFLKFFLFLLGSFSLY